MTASPDLNTVLGLGYTLVLAVASWTDLRSRRIPNVLTLPALAAALAVAWWHGTFALSLVGALVGVIAFILPMFLYGTASAGGGDVKLAAFVGAALGLQRVITALFVAGLVASVIVLLGLAARRLSRRSRIAFGPFIAFGGLVGMLLK